MTIYANISELYRIKNPDCIQLQEISEEQWNNKVKKKDDTLINAEYTHWEKQS